MSVNNGVDNVRRFFMFLTLWNFLICTVYLTLISIYEFLEKENSPFYKQLVHRVNKMVFTVCFTVVLGYWILTLMGPDIMQHPNSFWIWVLTVYIHLFIGVLIVIEFFTNSNRYYTSGFYWKDLLVLTLIMFVYNVILLSLSQNFKELQIYTFLSKKLYQCIGYSLMMIIFYFNGYLLYYSLARKYSKGKISYEKLMEEDFKITQPCSLTQISNDLEERINN